MQPIATLYNPHLLLILQQRLMCYLSIHSLVSHRWNPRMSVLVLRSLLVYSKWIVMSRTVVVCSSSKFGMFVKQMVTRMVSSFPFMCMGRIWHNILMMLMKLMMMMMMVMLVGVLMMLMMVSLRGFNNFLVLWVVPIIFVSWPKAVFPPIINWVKKALLM